MDGVDDSLLKNSRFVRLWLGQGLSFVGDSASTVALVLLVVDLSGSASAVGGVLVARLLPTLASPLGRAPAARARSGAVGGVRRGQARSPASSPIASTAGPCSSWGISSGRSSSLA